MKSTLDTSLLAKRSLLFSVFFVNSPSRVNVLNNAGSLSGRMRKPYEEEGEGMDFRSATYM